MKIKDTLVIAIAGLIFLMLTAPVRAETVTNYDGSIDYVKESVDGTVKHFYKKIEVQTKVSNRTCSEVDVPIYQNKDAKTGEVLGGAIIGGILGNQIGKGKGNDAATILGAILGADMANKKSSNKTIVGYKRTTICEDNPTYVTETKTIYSHSTIRFADGNRQYDIKFIAKDR